MNKVKQEKGKPIDEELLMRMMAGETEKPKVKSGMAETEDMGTGEQETEKEPMPAENVPADRVPDGKRKRNRQAADYDTAFLKGMDIPARYGKPVYVRREYHERIAKISLMLTGGKVSLSAYIDNVLAQHFEQYREEIEAAYAGKLETLF